MSSHHLLLPAISADHPLIDETNPLVAQLLVNRGITSSKKAHDFLNPQWENNYDPLKMKNIFEGIERLYKAVKENEHITIYADYDADGIPGAVVFSDFFKEIGYENIEVYFPHRNIDGFSLNVKAIEELAERETNLIVTIDCGITDVAEVKLANDKGMDVIITDHHEIGEEVPAAFAIVNPKQKGCKYKEKMLCGSGVIFKLTQALIRSEDHKIDKHFDKTLSVKIPEGTQPNTILRLKNKGLPQLNYEGNGDLYVKINVEIPTKTTKEQRKILLDYAKTLKDKSLLERMKKLFS
jgi:single-stranded DNA-specific DHH superfamily exonuclease